MMVITILYASATNIDRLKSYPLVTFCVLYTRMLACFIVKCDEIGLQ